MSVSNVDSNIILNSSFEKDKSNVINENTKNNGTAKEN